VIYFWTECTEGSIPGGRRGGGQPEHPTLKNNTETFLQASEDICVQVNVRKAFSLALFKSVVSRTNCAGSCYKTAVSFCTGFCVVSDLVNE